MRQVKHEALTCIDCMHSVIVHILKPCKIHAIACVR